MAETARLRLPEIAASQAQKHVTHNEALVALDTLVQLSVIDKDLDTPPMSPADGDCYIVAAGGTGDWTGWDDRIARYEDGAWRACPPGAGDGEGWLAYVQDEGAIYVLIGGAWTPLALVTALEGTWTPALGGTVTGDLAGATGLTVEYARYTKIGPRVTVHLGFTIDGLASANFTQKSTIQITGLPFAVRNDSGPIDYGGVSGMVYQSVGSAIVSLLGGGVGFSTNLYLFNFYTGSGEAENTDPFYVTATYLTDD